MSTRFRFVVVPVIAAMWAQPFLATTGTADDRRTDKSALVIMSFNAEFLFDGKLPDGASTVSFPWKGSPDEAEEHIAEVAAVINTHNPDIVNLIEVENLDVLEHMVDTYLAGNGYEAYLIEGTDTQTGQDVGLITRIDPSDGEVHRWDQKGSSGSVNKSVSKNYYASIPVDGMKIWFVGAHFLAQPDRADRLHQRQAQADAIRNLAAEKVESGDQLVIWGDLNDYDGVCADLQGHQPITAVLEILKKRDPLVDSDDLQNAVCVGNLPLADRYTAWWDKNDNGVAVYPDEFSSIDHILLSSGLVGHIERVEIPHTLVPGAVSDHFPLLVHLRFGPVAPTPAPSGDVRIAAVLANPEGDETEEETIWISNGASGTLALTGWRIRDKANTEWLLDATDGSATPGTWSEVKRKGRQMSINNAGDKLSLIDTSGAIRHVVDFGKRPEGEVLEFAP